MKLPENSEVFIFAGETSGDRHGSHLMQALKAQMPTMQFFGVGGPLMRSQGMTSLLKMEDFEVMGFIAVIARFPKLWRQFRQVRDTILQKRPPAVILIDYPGFNIRLAQALRKKGYTGKIIQYISPTVWAWASYRAKQMEQSLDLLLSILPFEPAYFASTSLAVKYVGHPTRETLQDYTYDDQWREKTGLPQKQPLMALFPGSRKKEIAGHLSTLLDVAAQLKEEQQDLCFALSLAREDYRPLIEQWIHESPLKLNQDIFLVPSRYSYELMRDCHSAIAKSGTVTLELALHEKPATVIYAVDPLNYLIARYCLRLKITHFCLVNILGNKTIFPELIAKDFTREQVLSAIRTLHADTPQRQKCIAGCQEVKKILGTSQASQEAARAIVELMS